MTTASIVTYRTAAEELRHILRLLEGEPVERVWIVDNGDDERIADICAEFAKAEYIPSGANRGYGAAHNIALRLAAEAEAELHLVLNSDIDFEPGAIATLQRYMKEHQDVGMAQPRLTDAAGHDLHSCRRLPTPADLFIRRFMPGRLFKKRREEYLLTRLDPGTEHNIPYHQGSFMMLRMSAVNECGGFDERFFMYPEDIDLTRRVHRNWRTMYVPEPVVRHLHRAESYKSLRMTAIHIVNMVRYFNKWGWLRDDERKRFNERIS